MSKVLYAFSRQSEFSEKTAERLRQICNDLTPDNIECPAEHKIHVHGQTAYCVSLERGTSLACGNNLLVGVLYENPGFDWVMRGSTHPDGSYALFRNDVSEVEVLSDAAGSRTIWYYHDPDIFVASTSQRAIVGFIGRFELETRCVSWMLSTGSLGPELSWSRKVRRLQPESSLTLDKSSWNLRVRQNPIAFSETNLTPDQHSDRLRGAIEKTISFLEPLPRERWLLPLSGGYDSRGILCFIKQRYANLLGLRAVTWGLEHSLQEEGNDAKIAKTLAGAIGVSHEYHSTDLLETNVGTLIDRFLRCSEGRIDHLAGYMDGMEIWRRFHDNNVAGVIRGDEGFGWADVTSEVAARLSTGCSLYKDFSGLPELPNNLAEPSQRLPVELERKPYETIASYRDRLYHAFRLPTILSALSDIKFSYIEQITPLISKRILSVVREMPDNLRTEKLLFKQIVNSLAPAVPIATKGANTTPKQILRRNEIVKLIVKELRSDASRILFGEEFVDKAIAGMRQDKTKSKTSIQKLKELLIRVLPKPILNRLRYGSIPLRIDGNILAFRAFIILKMQTLLESDARRFPPQG